jgi:hypothetical protein
MRNEAVSNKGLYAFVIEVSVTVIHFVGKGKTLMTNFLQNDQEELKV